MRAVTGRAVTSVDRDQLRLLVREVVRDAVADLVPKSPPAAAAPVPPSGPVPTGPLTAEERSRTDSVRLSSDQELDAFVRHLLRLFENPKTRDDLRQGRLAFRLAGPARGTTATSRRFERGAVTERHVAELAESGAALVLGPGAVLTPLGRERARALGITITKERR